MEIAGGVVGILANAFTLGREMSTLYQSLTEARTEIAERSTEWRAHWSRTEEQLDFVQRIWPSLAGSHQAMQVEILNVLIVRLRVAYDKLNGLLKQPAGRGRIDRKQPAVKRWKYMFVKPYLDDSLKSLRKWQDMYDPSWYLIMRVASPVIDAELGRPKAARPAAEETGVLTTARRVRGVVRGDNTPAAHLSLASTGLDQYKVTSIPYSTTRHVERPGKSGLVIDTIHCLPGTYVGDMSKDIRTLAKKLHNADPTTFGVLRCKGFTKNKSCNGSRVESFNLVLETPTTDPPHTLRKCLIAQTAHTLTERIELAKQLARSVNYVHTLDFVHKSIRPENLLGFDNDKLGEFFLVGFEQVRSAEGKSYFRGDEDSEKNLYRHPQRQGLTPDERYCMQHDIYSLGVCLLEIGMWQSFVLYPKGRNGAYPNTEMLGLSVPALRKKSANGIKKLLVDISKRELPSRMGELYLEVVINCLTCLDEENMDFGDEDEFKDDVDGVAVGVRYIEKILTKLNSINV